MLRALQTREYGRKSVFRAKEYPKYITKRINDSFSKIYDLTMILDAAVEGGLWSEIERAVGLVIAKILDNPNPEHVFHITQAKRQEREIFVTLGGMHLLLRLLGPPFHDGDGRTISSTLIHQRGELWNEILVILREVCFAIPPLADNIFAKHHIVFLFTMLHHQPVFENATNLLEEILAVRVDTFSLSDIPDFYSLIDKFTTRQLAHFCRVLALVLFEPEDRQIMESSQVLKSFELLQLRRDRMSKASNTVERNQSLIISMPQLLYRFVCLLRIINYGPMLSDLIRHNIVAQSPLTSDIMYFLSNNTENSEWQHFSRLDDIVSEAAANPPSPDAPTSFSSGSPSRDSLSRTRRTPPSSHRSRSETDTEMDSDDVMNELLAAFSPSGGQDHPAMYNLVNVMQVAQSLGIASMSPQGDAIMVSTPNNTAPNARRPPSARDARKELQFHAMVLAPHQVEVLFVLCTLLSGRRKIDVQQRFASLGLAQVLIVMYGRLSWDSPPYVGPNPLEHIHGPGCECNPESALRVQYLRLVHNFYDRDFHCNPIKALLLSPAEIDIIRGQADMTRTGIYLADKEKGLLSRIVDTLLKEPADSIYRFWLSSCVEAYLRGSGPSEQLFVVRTGLLHHLTTHIMSTGVNAASNLQTAFDLLGELIKCNLRTVEMFEGALVGDQFRAFMDIVMGNLVDSNVFLRTLFLSMESFSNQCSPLPSSTHSTMTSPPSVSPHLSHRSLSRTRSSDGSGDPIVDIYAGVNIGGSDASFVRRALGPGYLTYTWVQPHPVVLSARALVLDASTGSHVLSKGNNRRSACSSSRSSASFMLGASTLSSFSDGVRDAFRGLRDAASQLLGSSSPPPTVHRTHEREREREAGIGTGTGAEMDVEPLQTSTTTTTDTMDDRYDFKDDDGMFSTPRESPLSAERHPDGRWTADMVISDVCADGGVAVESKVAERKKTRRGMDTEVTSRITSSNKDYEKSPVQHADADEPSLDGHGDSPHPGWRLPDSLFRLSVFLIQERDRILLKLMNTVTMQTVNHENICCLNTALLILILAQRKDQLSAVLRRVRLLSREEEQKEKLASQSQQRLWTGSAWDVDVDVAMTDSTTDSSAAAAAPADSASDDTSIFVNFRELLWYWCEYYMRRGRDRLSLEFSSQIHFHDWRHLVATLCKDDGSATSLLAKPIVLPQSPYRLKPRPGTVFSEFCQA